MKIFSIIFRILQLIYVIYLYLADCFILFIRPPQEIENKILLVRVDNIGDFILWLDSARHFRKLYADKKIILLGNKAWTDLARRLPYWDEVWDLDKLKFIYNLPYRMRLLRKIRKTGFEMVIQPTYSRALHTGDAIIRVSHAREKIGSTGDCSNIHPFFKRISNRCYTQLIPANSKPLMELKRNAEFMRGLGLSIQAGLPDLSLSLKETSNLLSDVVNYYILFPGSGSGVVGRQWPINYFADLADRIYRRYGITAVMCGSKDEQGLAEAFISQVDIPIVNMTGKTNLVELAVIIKDALFVVGNDTSVIHLGAAVSTPAFCLLGGGHYGRFLPYNLEEESDKPLPVPIIHQMVCFNCNWNCRYSYKKSGMFPCIERISVDEVFIAIQPLINKLYKI